MSEDARILELYRLYLATAEKVSDRRASANSWMLSVNSAIVVLYGYLAADDTAGGAFEKMAWLVAIPVAGILVCLSWAALLASYSQLNSAKFEVLHEIERGLPVTPFLLEERKYLALGRRGFATVERRVPFAFMILYGALAVASLVASLM